METIYAHAAAGPAGGNADGSEDAVRFQPQYDHFPMYNMWIPHPP